MDWVQVETANLVIRTDLSRAKAVALATEYQRLRDAIAENEFQCAFGPKTPPLEVVIVSRNGNADLVLGRDHAGTYIGPPSYMLGLHGLAVIRARAAGSDTRVFTHEMAHQLISMCIPEVRPWLGEGVASFYETAKLQGDELLLGIRPYGFTKMPRAADPIQVIEREGTRVEVLSMHLAPPFNELRRMSPKRFYMLEREHSREVRRERTAHYAGAWLAVHLLQFSDPELAQSFSEYLGALASGEEDEQAWQGAFAGIDVESLYDRYVLAEHLVGTRQVSVRQYGEPVVKSLSSYDVALLWTRMIGWDTEPSKSSALRYIDHALLEAPQSSAPMLYRAALSQRWSTEAEVVKWLRGARQASPNDPDALAVSLLWYLRRPEILSSEAVKLAEWAARLNSNASTAFHYTELAEFALRSGNPKEALRLARAALALDATWWTTHLLLGEAYRGLGRQEDAQRAFRTAVSLTAHAPSRSREWLRSQIEALSAP